VTPPAAPRNCSEAATEFVIRRLSFSSPFQIAVRTKLLPMRSNTSVQPNTPLLHHSSHIRITSKLAFWRRGRDSNSRSTKWTPVFKYDALSWAKRQRRREVNDNLSFSFIVPSSFNISPISHISLISIILSQTFYYGFTMDLSLEWAWASLGDREASISRLLKRLT